MKPNVLIEALSISAEKAYRWVSHLSLAMNRFEIKTPRQKAAFLALVCYESEHLSSTVMNLRGIPAKRVAALWPKLFATLEAARPYAGTGPALANYVFANCNGNGDYESGDGYRFRPRGLLPLCGRTSYEQVSLALEFDFIHQPDALAEDHWAALSAGWYWNLENFNDLADQSDLDTITDILARRHLTDGRPQFDQVLITFHETLLALK